MPGDRLLASQHLSRGPKFRLVAVGTTFATSREIAMNNPKCHVNAFSSMLARLVIGLTLFIISASLPSTAVAQPFTQCPAVGADTSCAILIRINADGSVTTLTDPSQGPFDGIEDTLIGVQNNTTLTSIPNLTVSSGLPIFALDGDGICTFGLAGCPFGPTRYEGPNTSFTITDPMDGTVNFLAGGIPPGGSAFFSLEEPLSAASITVSVELAITSATGVPVAATEGKPFSGAVATFVDPDASATASEYSATIDWGDGSPTSSGTVSGSPSLFTISGSHTYSDEATYTVTVTITDVDNSLNNATANTSAIVADGALNSACAAPLNTLQSFSRSTATFTDQNPIGTASDFSATIDWGDSTTSTGSITGPGGLSPYTVSGSHTYTSTGFFVVATTVVDDGGNTTTATCRLLVYAFAPGGGSFVIGDEESTLATSVNFWGAQWAKNNPTTSASEVSSFKGFAESPVTPSCGTTWTADPGNSTPPPAGPLPAFMGVIVTNNYAKSGSQISGDTPAIVVVQTNPGYQPDPGHRGTGTVVQQVCP